MDGATGRLRPAVGALRQDRGMVDPVWAGVIGTAVGGVVGSATSLLSPLILWRTEQKRLVLEQTNAKELAEQKQRHDLERLAEESRQADRIHKRKLVDDWRFEVSNLESDYSEASDNAPVGSRLEIKMDPTGYPWFESLKPHLNREIQDVQWLVDYRHGWSVGTASALFDEIARIERGWGLA